MLFNVGELIAHNQEKLHLFSFSVTHPMNLFLPPSVYGTYNIKGAIVALHILVSHPIPS